MNYLKVFHDGDVDRLRRVRELRDELVLELAKFNGWFYSKQRQILLSKLDHVNRLVDECTQAAIESAK